LDRAQKEQLVASLHRMFEEVNLVVVTHQSGMTVAQAADLRRQMLQAGASFKVTKNRLARLALEGTRFTALQSLFTGPTAIAYSIDPVAAAKVCVDFAAKSQSFSVLGGALGTRVLDPDQVSALAKLPSLDELRAKLVGLLQAPATKLAGVLQAPAGQLARVLNAYASQERRPEPREDSSSSSLGD
jgi:large subunit ribosomal protein L10